MIEWSQQVDQEATQRDKKMLLWNLETDHQWARILKNVTKKINLSNIKEESKYNFFESSKREGDWDSSKSNNDESPIAKHKELQNLWSQYFRDSKTESDLIKERPPFLLKRKLSIIFSKDSERN